MGHAIQVLLLGSRAASAALAAALLPVLLLPLCPASSCVVHAPFPRPLLLLDVRQAVAPVAASDSLCMMLHPFIPSSRCRSCCFGGKPSGSSADQQARTLMRQPQGASKTAAAAIAAAAGAVPRRLAASQHGETRLLLLLLLLLLRCLGMTQSTGSILL